MSKQMAILMPAFLEVLALTEDKPNTPEALRRTLIEMANVIEEALAASRPLKISLEDLPPGWSDSGESWIEHHSTPNGVVTTIMSALSKELVEQGLAVISKQYHLMDDRTKRVAGYDAFRDKRWVGRFKTEQEATAATKGIST